MAGDCAEATLLTDQKMRDYRSMDHRVIRDVAEAICKPQPQPSNKAH